MNRIFFLIVLFFVQSACVPVLIGTTVTTATLLAIEDRSLGNAVDDTAILIKINKNLLASHLFSSVKVQVSEGRVLLMGFVSSRAQQIEAEKIAWHQKGVKEVINEVGIESDYPSSRNIAKDTMITTQLKAQMLANDGIKSVNYGISTVEGIVYIIGIAQSKEELQKVTSIARHIKGVKQVVSYVRLKDSKLRN